MDIGTSSHPADATYYDVFLSFRGEDTRYSFTDHLYQTLMRTTTLQIFRDDDEIDKGRELKPEIDKAIRISKASIVVLSENYANSTWCLEELSLILEQKKKANHLVFPIFYHVNPSDIRNQKGTFDIAVKTSGRWTYDNVARWKVALTKVAGLSGFPIIQGSTSETDIITTIVDTINDELDLKLVSTPAHLTGINTRAEAISSWLRNKQSDANVFAISGMGGSGKTTLAQYVYNKNKKVFESSSFLEEIGQYKQRQDFLGLQNKLLTDIFGGMHKAIRTVSEATAKIEDALEIKQVFLVLDDIEESYDLHTLLGTKALHTQSKIIITTRCQNMRALFGSISRRFEEQKLELMNDHESLELLSWHAFGSKVPMVDFERPAVQIANYCAGNPLALRVLGSSLFSQNIKHWTSTLRSLTSLKGDLDSKIQGVLRRSFDSLPNDSHKELFQHIACFFVGEYRDYVVKTLEHDWYAEAGIKVLIDRSLLTVSPSKKLTMHQLLQEMVRKMVRENSRDPAEHKQVWCSDEACDLLTKGEGSKIIEGLSLDMQEVEKGTKTLAFKTSSLAKMDKLKLLQLKYVKLTGSYKNFPELRWLCWHGCRLRTIRSGLLMSSLVALDMSYGKLEIFEPPMVLNSLKILNLKGSEKLVSICNLCQLPNLEDLILWNCCSLTHVCKTIGGLKSLSLLDLTGCGNLWKVSSKKMCVNEFDMRKIALCIGGGIPQLPLFSLPHSLKFLFLNDFNLQHNNKIPVLFSGQPFSYMNLGNNLFEFLPNNIDLKSLRVLDMTSCPKLKSLLCLPSTLEELYTYWCESLETITFQSGRFRLRKFGYEGCVNLSEIQGLLKLVPLKKLDEADMQPLAGIKTRGSYMVELVGDEITEHRMWDTQMLYEYGIMSTYLMGVMVGSNMPLFDYKSSSSCLSFLVPLDREKFKIQGLKVGVSYRPSGEDEDTCALFAKICNTTEGLTWMYNPVVYGKSKDGEDVVWLSYWPIGYKLNAGNEVKVSIVVGNGLMVSGCGVGLVYADSEVEQENWGNSRKNEEVIGGDLSEFELSKGVYYLCRHDFFKSMTLDWLKMLLGDTIQCKDLQGWRKSRHKQPLTALFMEMKTFRGIALRTKIVLRLNLVSQTQKRNILKELSSVSGVESVAFDTENEILTIIGRGAIDHASVEIKVRKYAKMAQFKSCQT